MRSRVDQALALSATGLVVVPAHRAKPGATKASSAQDQGKLPYGTGWQKAKRLEPDAIIKTWGTPTPPNISVLTGAPSGIFVLDIDPDSGGFETMKRLVAQYGPMPATYTVQTGSGGWHYYFLMPDFDVRNKQSWKELPGVDIRGTGGQAIAATSVSYKGPYDDGERPVMFASAPEWLLELLRRPAPVSPAVPTTTPAGETSKPGTPSPYEANVVSSELDRLHALQRPWQPGAGWDSTTYEVACVLTQIANSPWAALTHERAEQMLLMAAPRDDAWGEKQIDEKLSSARRSVGGKQRPAPTQRIDDSGLFAGSSQASVAPAQRVISADLTVDVSSPALAAQWLTREIGTTRLSGVFFRKGDLVYTPRIGEEGYIAPRNAVAEGAASITIMTEHDLQARIQQRYEVIRQVEQPPRSGNFTPKPAIFPLEAAKIVVRSADDAPHLREMVGVVHAPTFRPDGTLITAPGYDETTQLLFLPTGGQPDAIPEHPTPADLQLAVKTVDYMLQDFQFVTEHDRATYIGLMLTPLLRTLVPPPYKLGVVEAHQPGSGKSFLARALASIHGGVMHAEMPSTEEELAKVVGSILDTQTSPVVAFDNVSGLVRSSTLAGLLTSPTFQGRRLGVSALIEANNDRLWVITGNNAQLGGDLKRRNTRVRIDPGVPNPELRTGFAISNFEGWVRENRGALLWALLVLTRAWVAAGMRLTGEPTQDSYGQWVAVVRGILANAGIPGTFDDPSTADNATDADEDEWAGFLAMVHERFEGKPWTAKSLLSLVAHPAVRVEDPTRPIPFDALPSGLMQAGSVVEPTTLSTKLGRWLANREGRWYGSLSVVRAGEKTMYGVPWVVKSFGS